MSDPTAPSKSKRKKKSNAQSNNVNELAPPEPVTTFGESLSAANPFDDPPSRPYYANRPAPGMPPHGMLPPPGMMHPGMMQHPANIGMPPLPPNMAMQHPGVNMGMQHPGINFPQPPGPNMNMHPPNMMHQFVGPPRNAGKFPPGSQPNMGPGPFDGGYPPPNFGGPNPGMYPMNMPGMPMNIGAGGPPMRAMPQQAGVCCAVCAKMLVCDPNSEHQPIPCGTCGAWYHRSCTMLSEAAYHALYADNESAEWLCEKCETTLGAQIPYVKWRTVH